MDNGIMSIEEWLRDIFTNTYSVCAGAVASILGYFLPLKDPVNLLLIFFVVDCIIGYLKNRKLYKQKFSKRKIFETTIPRMMAVTIFMMLLFSLDMTFNQDMVQTYMIVGYFVGGVLLFNIWKNLYELTRWDAFLNIGEMLQKNVKDRTGMDVDNKNNKEAKHESNN
ncbi:phage holin family protein [Proteiniphilum sp.]|uniref:phage holin family protein n=1 Tax=Proteiniphilum sp. TaxID=1926877 RepID=UPI00332E58ED